MGVIEQRTLTGTILSVQVGQPQPLEFAGGMVESAIRKAPIEGRVSITENGLDGDRQADLIAHGGPDKAACCYAQENIPRWHELLGEIPYGGFGENLRVEGLPPESVHVGDVFELGSAVVQVSQPRSPCYKVGARWGFNDLAAVMSMEGNSGYYLRVLEPGDVGAGDEMRLVERRSDISVAEVMRVSYRDRKDVAGVRAVVAVPELADQWKDALKGLLAKLEAAGLA